MKRAEELSLINRARAGDRLASEALVRAQQQSLYAYMLRMCGRHDVAEDVTQEAFVRALTSLDRFDTRYRFSTWLFTIAKRLYLNMCDRRRPLYDTDIVESRRGASRPDRLSIGAVEERALMRDEIQIALDQVPERQREVLILFHQQNWPIALIAEHLGIPEGTVKSHLHRGRRRLRAALASGRESLVREVYLEA
ncbi:MAG: RNA polymerase sigma factor [Phycisphaerales bacterium JB039]